MPQVNDPAILSQLNGGGQPAAPRGPVFGPAPPPPPAPTPIQQEGLQNDRTRVGIALNSEDRAQTAFEQGNVSEQQAKFLLSRVGGGIDDLNFVFKEFAGSDRAPNLSETVLFDAFGPNNVVTRGMTDEGRRAVQDIQVDILDSLLTLGTGQAYNKEQLDAARAAYFPQFNDSDKLVALKRRKLERLFGDAAARAGPLAGDLEKYKGQFFTQSDAAPAEPNKATARDENPYGVKLGLDGGDDSPFDRNRYLQERFGIDPGQESRLVGMFNANIGNKNATPEMVAGFYEAAGLGQRDPSSPEIQRMAADLRDGNFSPTTGVNVDAAEREYVEGLDQVIDKRANVAPENQGATLLGSFNQGSTFEGFDEIAGVVGGISEGLQGGSIVDGYRGERDLARRYVERSDAANPNTALVGRLAGGLTTGVLGSVGRPATLGNAAKTGAVEGGVLGFNSGEGAQQSLIGAGIGAPAGALLGTAIQAGTNKVTNTLASRAPAVDPAQVQSVVDAGARRGVTVRQPDVNPAIRNKRAQVQQTEQGRSAIGAADQSDLGEIETALIRDLGGRAGTQRTEAAESVQQGVKTAREGLRKKAQVEYRAAAAQAGNVTAPPTNAVAAVDQQIAELASNGRNLNSKEIAYLEGLKADLTQNGGLSIEGLRAQRTGLRNKLENANVYSSDFERRIGLVLDDASKDIEAALQPFPQALSRYQKADGLWRQQAEFGGKVGDLLLGRDGNLAPGQAADRLMGWAKKDPARLNRMLSEVDAGTKEEVRALVASQLGRAANGDFSLGAFLTQTSGGRGGSLSPAAIRSLFGKDGAKAIEDLRILSQAKVDAASATNRSNTGGLVQQAKNSFRRLVLGGFGFGAAADAGTGLGVLAGGATVATGELFERIGRERSIRLLLDPDFTGWLRRLPNTSNPQAINRSVAGLRSVSARSPVMATDIQALERALIEVANDNPASALAAEEQPNEPN